MPKLNVIAGPHTGEMFELTDQRVRVGRDFDNTIRLPDGNVSRHHAELIRDGHTYFVRDLSSSNGTFINGEPVTEAPLQDGDSLRMADVEMRFENGAAQPASPTMGLKTPVFKQPPSPASQPVTPLPPAATPPTSFFARLLHRTPAPPTAAPAPKPPATETPPPAIPTLKLTPPSAPKEIVLKADPPPAKESIPIKPPIPEKQRLYTRPFPEPQRRQPEPEEEFIYAEAPRRKIAPFLVMLLVGVLVLIAGYTLDSNAFRFFGLLLLIVGALCLFHDWSPLPPKAKPQ